MNLDELLIDAYNMGANNVFYTEFKTWKDKFKYFELTRFKKNVKD